MNSTHPQRSDFGLRSLRRQQWVKWVQLVTVVVWSLFPPFYSPMKADWVPSSTDQMVPVWDGNGEEPAGGADFGDSDLDGLVNWFEEWLGTIPGTPDSDNDGLSDGFEFSTSGTSPLTWDSDSDGVSDHDAYYLDFAVNHNTAGFGVTVFDWDGDGHYNPDDDWPFDPYNGNGPPWVDSDGDGVPDHEDAWPFDFYNGGGSGSGSPDSDGDGTPDDQDPWPNDPYNGDPPPSDPDSDGDSFPDSVDTHPGDASRWSDHNGNGFNDWEDTPYNTDTDGDGHFNGNDSDPSDATLWNDHSPRNGINDQDEPPPVPDPSTMVDNDNDGYMDAGDSHPGNGSLWSDWDNDGLNAEDEMMHGTDPLVPDTDGEGLLDGEEIQYQTDPLNSDTDDDGLTDFEELRNVFGSSALDEHSLSKLHGWGELYTDWQLADLADTDGDGIPNKVEELYAPLMNKANAADGGWDLDADGVSNLQAYHNGWTLRSGITGLDRDGDGIEDALEDQYPGVLDKFDFADAVEDADGDDLMNWQEVEMSGFHPGQAQSRYPGVADHMAAFWHGLAGDVGAYMMQGGAWWAFFSLSQIPESYATTVNDWGSMEDLDENALPDGLEAFLADVALADLPEPGRAAAGDYDGDDMPDGWEWQHRLHLNVLDASDAGLDAGVIPPPPPPPDPNAFDQNTIEGVEAYQAAMATYEAVLTTQQMQDLDSDGLSNLMEYQLSTHPLIPDSDGDGVNDGAEVAYGGNPANGNDTPATQLEIIGGSQQTGVVGAVSGVPLTVRAMRVGLPRGGMPLLFHTQGFGQVGQTANGPWSTQVLAVTNGAGEASVHWKAPATVGTGTIQAQGLEAGTAPLSVPTTAQPTGGGGPGGPGNPPGPVNPTLTPPPEPILFTSERVITGMYSGAIGTGELQESTTSSIAKTGWVVYTTGVQHDGWDGDLDTNADPNDAGDPRDENLQLASPMRNEVEPHSPGSIEDNWTEDETVLGSMYVGTVTKGRYHATNQVDRMKNLPTGRWEKSTNTGIFDPAELASGMAGVLWGYEEGMQWMPGEHGWRGDGATRISPKTAYYSHTKGTAEGTLVADDELPDEPWSAQVTSVSVRNLQVRVQSNRAPTVEQGPRSAAFVVMEKVTPVNADGTTGTPVTHVKGSITLTVEVGRRVASKCETTGAAGPLVTSITTNLGSTKVIELIPAVASENQIVELSLLPVEIKWEAKPEFNNLSDNKSPVDYVWHIQRSIGAQDGRWMPGRGLRIFPDKETPTGQLRNKVQLKIKAGSIRADKKVFVRVYDVDDPTPTSFDSGGQVDANGDAGGDNIGSDQDHDDFHFISGGAVSNASVQKSGNSQQHASCDVTLDASNEATIEMQVSMQPSDNFRATVALDPADFSTIQVASPGGSGFLKPSSEAPQGFKGAVSDMLTVWRSLSLEFDTMAAPPAGNYPPDKQSVAGLQWPSSSQVTVASLGVPDDFYKSGIAFVGGGQLPISTNAPSALTFTAPVDAATQAQMTNHAFTIVDDDGRGLPADYSPMLPRQMPITDQLRARFVTSYIELKDVGSLNTSTEVPFEANALPALLTSMDDARNVEDSDGYWNHLLIAAYQSLEGEDRDPNSEEYTMGATNPWTPKRSAIYMETIRDQYHLGLTTVASPAVQAQSQAWFKRDVQGCIAHETAHAPSGFFDDDHSEGGLIGAGEVDIDTHVFEPVTVRRFRNTLSWGVQP